MEVISMVVNDEFGVMQRVMGVFTRKRINVDTIVVGRCEIAGKSRIVLTVNDRAAADIAIADLLRLHDVVHAETVDGTRHEAYALVSNSAGKARLIGSIDEVDKIIDTSKPDAFIRAVNAL
ncbi:MAG TPA: ACT domain-containing protein [Methanomassiliicoccales archaeon]|nr:ACT domain-containing protein [Methanomassiliicoccales archaeon]HXZ23942.1 ACT domain-containing protein [Methanomassiliicoccales archaeon]